MKELNSGPFYVNSVQELSLCPVLCNFSTGAELIACIDVISVQELRFGPCVEVISVKELNSGCVLM